MRRPILVAVLMGSLQSVFGFMPDPSRGAEVESASATSEHSLVVPPEPELQPTSDRFDANRQDELSWAGEETAPELPAVRAGRGPAELLPKGDELLPGNGTTALAVGVLLLGWLLAWRMSLRNRG